MFHLRWLDKTPNLCLHYRFCKNQSHPSCSARSWFSSISFLGIKVDWSNSVSSSCALKKVTSTTFHTLEEKNQTLRWPRWHIQDIQAPDSTSKSNNAGSDFIVDFETLNVFCFWVHKKCLRFSKPSCELFQRVLPVYFRYHFILPPMPL